MVIRVAQVAVYYLGTFIGAVIAGELGDRVGELHLFDSALERVFGSVAPRFECSLTSCSSIRRTIEDNLCVKLNRYRRRCTTVERYEYYLDVFRSCHYWTRNWRIEHNREWFPIIASRRNQNIPPPPFLLNFDSAELTEPHRSLSGLLSCRLPKGVVLLWDSRYASSHQSFTSLLENDNNSPYAQQFFLNICGLALAYWIEFSLRGVDESLRWRLPLAIQIVFLIMLLGSISFFPESPRWLARMGEDEEALAILARLRTEDADETDKRVREELEQVMEVVTLDRQNPGGNNYLVMMTNADRYKMGRRVGLVVSLQLMQQLVGIAVITVYAPTGK